MGAVPIKPWPKSQPKRSLDSDGNTEWDKTAHSTYKKMQERMRARKQEILEREGEIRELKRQIRIKLIKRAAIIGLLFMFITAACYTLYDTIGTSSKVISGNVTYGETVEEHVKVKRRISL